MTMVDLRSALPYRTRLRLWLTGLIDSAAIWLCRHGRFRAAERTWRIFGLW